MHSLLTRGQQRLEEGVGAGVEKEPGQKPQTPLHHQARPDCGIISYSNRIEYTIIEPRGMRVGYTITSYHIIMLTGRTARKQYAFFLSHERR